MSCYKYLWELWFNVFSVAFNTMALTAFELCSHLKLTFCHSMKNRSQIIQYLIVWHLAMSQVNIMPLHWFQFKPQRNDFLFFFALVNEKELYFFKQYTYNKSNKHKTQSNSLQPDIYLKQYSRYRIKCPCKTYGLAFILNYKIHKMFTS